MRELLNQIGTVKSSSRSATTAQLTVTHANDETDAQMRLLPLSQSNLFGALGGGVATETYQLWIDADVTIAVDYLVTLDGSTYKIMSVETYGTFETPDFHKCLVQKMMST